MREYNKGYNYFAGLPDEEVVKHQKSDTIGHRPTWFIGANAWSRNRGRRNGARPRRLRSPLRRLRPHWACSAKTLPAAKLQAAGPNARSTAPRANACVQLDLEDSATKADIKARFKELVKRLHPDHNQGDRTSEDKLREVIQAYNYLRQAGLA